MSLSKKLVVLFSLAMVLGTSPATARESCIVCVGNKPNEVCLPPGC